MKDCQKWLKKLMALSISIALLTSPTVKVFAEGGRSDLTVEAGKMKLDMSAANARVGYSENTTSGGNADDVKYEVNIDVDLVQRTLVNIDIAKFLNSNNACNQDYKPSLKDKLLELVPEHKYADIIEYEDFENAHREPINVDSKSATDYASKLEYLIKKNMINRTTYYLFNAQGIYADQGRVPRPITKTKKKADNSKKGQDIQSTTGGLKHKFYNPENKISKTDFLTELMKIDGIEESRPIFVRSPYKRCDENFNIAQIESEPVETSPYARLLGSTGLDYASNDVIAWHDVFKQTDVTATNDVTEYYLINALNKNVITSDEIGGDEGLAMLGNADGSKSMLKDGYLNRYKAIRQFYDNPDKAKLHERIREEDIVYPEGLSEVDKVKKTLVDVATNTDAGTLPPWGYSYYSNAENCIFANPYNQSAIELIKRPSVVEVNNGYWKYTPTVKTIQKDNGYAYFKKEEITEAEAYVLAYKLLLALGSESKLTQTEIDYLNSKYSLNFSSFTADERQAVEYLIAKGILDGNSKSLANASSTSLTNEVAIDIIYRIANPEARIKFEPQLTAIDLSMASQGYSQASITKTSENIGDFSVVSDVTAGKKVTSVDGNGIASNSNTYSSLQGKDRAANPATYDLVYIRLPKTSDTGGKEDTTTWNLVVDDDFRTKILPVNKLRLDYGNSDKDFNKNLDKQIAKIKSESITEDCSLGDETNYIFKDEQGYYWRRYLLHKQLSSKVILNGFSGDATYTYTGIRGEGMYIAEDSKTGGELRKVSLSDGSKYDVTRNMKKYIVKLDENTRNYVSANQPVHTSSGSILKVEGKGFLNLFSNKAKSSVPTEGVLWSQYDYMADDVAKISSISLGNDPSKIDLITYNGKQMFKKDSQGNYTVSDDLGVPDSVAKCFKGVVKTAEGNYFLNYQSPYQDYALDTVTDVINRMSYMGAEVNPSGDVKLPGYAKIAQNGNYIALVTAEELKNTYGIEVKSEKMLYNPITGQRAFFNTVDNNTLIGNNITQYGENQLIVTAHGDDSGKVLYYNLQSALELINDTEVVCKKAGYNIYTAIGKPEDADRLAFRQIKVKDVTKGTASSGYTTIDRTYVTQSKNSVAQNNAEMYINLSAMCGNASNFIYYKNKEHDLNLLVVYNPYVNNAKLKQYEGAKVPVDNSLLKSTMATKGHDTIISSSANSADTLRTDAKRMILQTLFGASEESAVSSLLSGPYNIDIYILTDKSPSNEVLSSKFSDLIALFTEQNTGKLEVIKNSLYRIDDKFKVGSFADFKDKKELVDGTNITINYKETQPNFFTGSNYICHKDSGNLYYRICKAGSNSNGKPVKIANVTDLKDTLGTRFFYNDKGTKDVKDDCLYMRSKLNFTNAGDNYIPLEMYSMPEYRNGLALSKSDGTYNYNLGKRSDTQGIKLTSSDRTSASSSANVYISKMKKNGQKETTDVGLATMLELPYRELTQEQMKTLFNKTIFCKDSNGSHAAFLAEMYKIILTQFKAVKNGDNSIYDIESAMGTGEYAGTSVGWDYESSDNEKEQFLQGMWHITSATAYYMPNRISAADLNKKVKTYVLIPSNVANSDNTSILPTHDAIAYLGEVSNLGSNTTIIMNIKAISSFDQLPERLRLFIEKGDGKYLTQSKESLSTADTKIKSDPIKVIYKPSLAVPAGTTLLTYSSTQEGDVDTLVLAPKRNSTYTSSIRTVYHTAKDVINTCLALEQEEPTFLYQVPKGSRILLGNMQLLKFSAPDTNSQHLRWVKCITEPEYTADNKTVVTQNRDRISELTLLTKYITKIYNVEVPLAGGAKGVGGTNLGEIMGPGAYRIPTEDELKYILSEMTNNIAAKEMYSGIRNVFGLTTSGLLDESKKTSYMAYNAITYNFSNDLAVSKESDASVLLTLNVPPSLQVEEDPDMENTFKVVGYWDINQFNVDPSGEMVSYLKSKDTEVVPLNDIVADIKAQDTSGLPYMKAATLEHVEFTMKDFFAFLTYSVPAIVLIIWIIRTALLIIFSYPAPRNWANGINESAGRDVMRKLTLGMYRGDSDKPVDIGRYVLCSFLLAGVLSAFYMKYIIEWVSRIFHLN